MYTPQQHAKYMSERYRKLKERWVQQLGGKCVRCGATDNLQFDHIDPKTKKFSIGKLWSKSEEEVQKELAKCQLLCDEHHKEKTLSDRPRRSHGTWAMYSRGKCRCEVCRAFVRDYFRTRRKN